MRTRDKIIQASIELFNSQGERQVTTNHIAAHIGISPGNLYYHFRNKGDIIQHIFSEYQTQLSASFAEVHEINNAVELLKIALDDLFRLMWRFNFFYTSIVDILSRDCELHHAYLKTQMALNEHLIGTVEQLTQLGLLNIDASDVEGFVHNLKLTVTFWLSYVKTQRLDVKIEKTIIYQGILAVLLLFKPYMTDQDRQGIIDLQQYYAELAKG